MWFSRCFQPKSDISWIKRQLSWKLHWQIDKNHSFFLSRTFQTHLLKNAWLRFTLAHYISYRYYIFGFRTSTFLNLSCQPLLHCSGVQQAKKPFGSLWTLGPRRLLLYAHTLAFGASAICLSQEYGGQLTFSKNFAWPKTYSSLDLLSSKLEQQVLIDTAIVGSECWKVC